VSPDAEWILFKRIFRQDQQDLLDIFFGFPDESQKFQSPPANKKLMPTAKVKT
jgi:hypothetical protein